MYRKVMKTLLIMLGILSAYPSFAQDPMRPPNWVAGSRNENNNNASTLNLQQILISKNRKIAIINEKVVIEGDKIDGAKVINISDKWVKVVRAGRTITLRITPTTKEYSREK